MNICKATILLSRVGVFLRVGLGASVRVAKWRSWVLVAETSLPGVRLLLPWCSGKGCKLEVMGSSCRNLSAWVKISYNNPTVV